jgi:hypothetical protein
VLLASVPVLVFAVRAGQPGWWALAVVAIAAIGARLGRSHPGAWPAVAVGVGVATWLALGAGSGMAPRVAVIASASLLLWAVVLGVVTWEPRRTRGGRVLIPAIGPVVVADAALVFGTTLWLPGALIALALVVALVCLAMPSTVVAVEHRTIDRIAVGRFTVAVDRFAGAVGTVVSVILMVPVLVVVTIGWLINALTRHDPLAAPTPEPGRWVARTGSDGAVDRYFGSVPVVDAAPASARLSRYAAALLPMVLVVGLVAIVVQDRRTDDEPEIPLPRTEAPAASPTTTTPRTDDGPAACGSDEPAPPIADDPDTWPDLLCETQEMGSAATFYAPAGYRLKDYRGDHVNIEGRVRRTWRPPPCDCERVKVWLLGGSAAWGYLQSDQHTFASAVAREAWRRGIALDITTYAEPGYSTGQEVRMFADLLQTHEPPDIALFYDGGNDLVLQAQRYFTGSIDDESDVQLMETAQDDLLRFGPLNSDLSRITFRTPQFSAEPPADLVEAAPEIARHAMARYQRQTAFARRLGQSYGVDVLIGFQPLFDGSDPKLGLQGFSPASIELFKGLFSTGRALVPEGVVDFSDAFRNVDRPVFYDQFHTTEHGSTIVAAAVVDRLEPLAKGATG